MDANAPSLTARRKAATQLDIARAAARLFTEHGPDRTTADDIAAAAGIALRTFYRYFRSKEDAVAPLLSVGADRWRAALASAGPAADPIATIEKAIISALTPGTADDVEGFGWTRGLLRAGVRDQALMVVWYRVNRESEAQLLRVIRGLASPAASPLAVRLAAAAATDAIRVALEAWAESDAPLPDPAATGPGTPADLAVHCFRQLSGSITLAG
ncbi:TetR/AcrR family transcriptional regulator [Specibacter cremeus]|uniref:TetR/AcrR family transcriptional regulator n=1 Tax=Specibacter cremeus TaxID=1629051 RepID=UPI000F79A78F|nr:TetR/AcrR family transcriptional regulator [Specibacter cremeus]